MFKATKKKINFSFNQYLSNYDLINKYNLKNIYDKPTLNKIEVELPLEDFLILNKNFNKTQFDSDLQIKNLFLIYLLVSFIPFISFKQIKVNGNIKSDEHKFILKINLFSYELNIFLNFLFIDISSSLNLNDLKFNNKNLNISDIKFIYKTKILATDILELDFLLKKQILNFNIIDLNLHLNFHFFTKNQNLDTNLIKNIPLFWNTL